MMNQCHFLGNFVRDPEIRDTPSGKKVINFTIGVNRRFKRGDDMIKETAFIDCEAWDTGAELIAKYFKKGDPIIVHCSVKQDNWTDKDTGAKRNKIKFRVNQFDFIPGGRKSAPEADDGEVPNEEPAGVVTDGADIPF